METLLRLLHRRRPAEGWLLWLLALLTLLLTAVSAGAAGWVPHLGLLLSVVIIAGYSAAFGFGRVLSARGAGKTRRLAGWWAALGLALLGIALVSLLAGWREAPQPGDGLPGLALPLARAGLALGEMAARLAQWAGDLRAAGQVNQDDAVFRWLLGLLAWGAAAWAGWWLFVRRQTLAAFLPAGLLLAGNAYVYWDGRIWLPFFLGGVTVVAVLMQRHALERRWTSLGMDYPADVRQDILASAGGLALLVILAGFLMPSVVLRPTASWFTGQMAAPLQRIEQAGQRAFPGLRRAPGSLLATDLRSGALPRGHLLTDGPELGEAVVMRVSTDQLAGLAYGQPPTPAMRHNWRGITFDLYTGSGWRNSGLLAEEFAAGEPWTEEALPARVPLRQWVSMERSGDRALYAAGEPLAANRPYQLLVRGDPERPADHMAAMLAAGRRYQVLSLIPAATADQLRAAGTIYPAGVAQLYLALPELPARIGELAQEVTAGAATPYDQALALQDYLRQFSYDLAVAPPPAGRDVVDYFLFDAQRGYCDYYASALVVMARTLGIPARLAVGYTSGSYDPAARGFVVREQDAHSWPELYFPQIGWVSFEPTAAMPPPTRETPADPLAAGAAGDDGAAAAAQVQADLQTFRDDQTVRQRAGWLAAALALAVLAAVAWLVWRRRPAPELAVLYGRLARWGRRLGLASQPGDTPAQLGQALGSQMQDGSDQGAAAAQQVQRFMHSYEAAQYSPRPVEAEQEARRLWPGLERALRRRWWGRG